MNLVERLGFVGLKARAPVDKYARLAPGQGVQNKPGWLGVPIQPGLRELVYFRCRKVVYALRVAPSLASIAFLACSKTALKASGLAIASSDRDLRSRSMLAALRPSMKRE